MHARTHTTLVELVQPPVFNPTLHCAGCKFPLVLDETVQTSCQYVFQRFNKATKKQETCNGEAHHTFHKICLTQALNTNAAKIAEKRKAAEQRREPNFQPGTIAPCPECRSELNETLLTPVAVLPKKNKPDDATDEEQAGECILCSFPKDPLVMETDSGERFHAPCFPPNIEVSRAYDGSQIRNKLHLPPLSPPGIFSTSHEGDVDEEIPIPPLPILNNNDEECSDITAATVALILIASTIAYLANLFFFAGTNPILYAIGLPAGLILEPFLQAQPAGAIYV